METERKEKLWESTLMNLSAGWNRKRFGNWQCFFNRNMIFVSMGLLSLQWQVGRFTQGFTGKGNHSSDPENSGRFPRQSLTGTVWFFFSIDWLIFWLTDLLIDWLIDWLTDFSIDWLIDWLEALKLGHFSSIWFSLWCATSLMFE